ncbi:MAG: DUF5691 domain-containing protein [Thermoflexibacter sp.]|nr:DUF5691 domain-containing protein [Thermoflexibacter sp.]
MSFWEKLVNNALLGTDKQEVELAHLPEALQSLTDSLAQDQETRLLQVATLLMNFEKAGKNLPTLDASWELEIAKEEVFPYCNEKAISVLENLIYEKHHHLIKFYLFVCAQKKQIVFPTLLPELLNWGRNHLESKELISRVIGNRGMWLAYQNPTWYYLLPEHWEEDWLHGRIEERKSALKKIRQTQPLKALSLLEQSWAEESASQKTEYLQILEENLSIADEEFLKNRLSDRSGKVKTEATRLLRLIPDSELSQQTWEAVSACFTIKKPSKTSRNDAMQIEFELANTSHGLWIQTDKPKEIESNQSKIDYSWIYAWEATIIPERWEKHFQLAPHEIIEAFLESKNIKKHLQAILEAVIIYKNERWARAFLQNPSIRDARLLYVLPYQERKEFAISLMSSDADEVVEAMQNDTFEEWSLEFTQKLMEIAIKDIYSYNKDFFKQLIPFLHFEVNSELLNYSFPDDYRKGYWKGTATEISYLLGLREEIKQVFFSTQ